MNLQTARAVAQEAKSKNPTHMYLIIERRYSLLGKTYRDYAVVWKDAYEQIQKAEHITSITVIEEV